PDLPAPSVRTKRLPNDPVECWCKVRQGTRMLTERQGIKTQVNARADLHVAYTIGASECQALLIIRDSTGDITALPVKPPTGIHETTDDILALALYRLCHPFLEHGAGLGVVPSTPAGEAEVGKVAQLTSAIVDGMRHHQPLLRQLHNTGKMPLPVRKRCQMGERLGEIILKSLLAADPHCLLEVSLCVHEVATILIHEPKAAEAPRPNILIPGVVEEVHRFLSILFHKGNMVARRFAQIDLRQVTQTVALFVEIARRTCYLVHHL